MCVHHRWHAPIFQLLYQTMSVNHKINIKKKCLVKWTQASACDENEIPSRESF